MNMQFPKSIKSWAWAAGMAGSVMMISGPAMAAQISYHKIASIALPASPNSGDVVAYDPGNHYIYTAYGAGGLAVIDATTNKLVADVKGIQKPNGLDFNADYVFVADGKANALLVISKKTWKVVDSISTVATDKTATTPDGVVVDNANNQVFVTIDDNNTVQVYSDQAPFKLLHVINLNTVVPNASIDNVGPDLSSLSNGVFYESDGIYLLSYNAKTLQNIGKIDTGLQLKLSNGKLATHAGLKQSTEVNGKVFVGGDGAPPNEIRVFNPTLTHQYAPIMVPGNSDALVSDSNNGMVYGFVGGLPGGGGFIVIDSKTDAIVASVTTGGHAHTGAVDTANGDVYVLHNGSAANPASASVDVYALSSGKSTVPNATSPTTGVPMMPLVGGSALVLLGAAALYTNRRTAKR